MGNHLVPWKFATGVALIAFGMSLAAPNVGTAGVIGYTVAVFGLFYALGLVLSAYLAGPGFERVEQDDRQSKLRQAQDGVLEKTELVGHIRQPTARELPQWQQFLERRFYSDDRFLVGNRPVYLPETVDVDHIYWLAEWRAEGKLPQVSTRALDALGISRWGQPPNAVSMIEFLEQVGAVESLGDRQPYKWTQVGEETFPELLETAVNGASR